MANVAITTAVTNAYDHPRANEIWQKDCDYFFFADEASEHLVPKQWQHVPLESNGHPRRDSKPPKLNPHKYDFLRDYEYVIWVDGSIVIHNLTFVDEILAFLKNGMVLSPHFDGRKDAYGEATIRPPKYALEPFDEQCAYYRGQGFPTGYGLYECGVIARNMKSEQVELLGKLWMDQVELWSIQDQVSLPYCLWRLEYEPDVLPQSFRDYGWVSVNAHMKEEN